VLYRYQPTAVAITSILPLLLFLLRSSPAAAVLNAFVIRPVCPGDKVAVIGMGDVAQLAARRG